MRQVFTVVRTRVSSMQLLLLLRRLASTTQPPLLRHRSSGLGEHMRTLAAHLTTMEGARLLDIICSNDCGVECVPRGNALTSSSTVR